MVHRQQQVTLTANQGQNGFAERSCLTGDVHAVGQRRQSINKALTWYLPSQLVEANGDVVYRQVEPQRVYRSKAVGKNQTIVVSGGRVVTEIVP